MCFAEYDRSVMGVESLVCSAKWGLSEVCYPSFPVSSEMGCLSSRYREDSIGSASLWRFGVFCFVLLLGDGARRRSEDLMLLLSLLPRCHA